MRRAASARRSEPSSTGPRARKMTRSLRSTVGSTKSGSPGRRLGRSPPPRSTPGARGPGRKRRSVRRERSRWRNIRNGCMTLRACLKSGGVPDWGRFFCRARRFDAGILADFKSNQRSVGGKRCSETAFRWILNRLSSSKFFPPRSGCDIHYH